MRSLKQTLRRLVLLLTLLLTPLLSSADILVFVHGYYTQGHTWRTHGVLQTLSTRGLADSGNLVLAPGGALHIGPDMSTGNHMVTANLPDEAPIEIQGAILGHFLGLLATRYPGQQIRLIGHSAGGVVARMTLVTNPGLPVVQLITIASPHRGSAMARLGKLFSATPMGKMAGMMGADELEDSEALYSQLSRPRNNKFLRWLNNQPHPPMDYVSVIRGGDNFIKSGEYLVSKQSQNMAFVRGIGPRARVIHSRGGHSLRSSDALAILSAIGTMPQPLQPQQLSQTLPAIR